MECGHEIFNLNWSHGKGSKGSENLEVQRIGNA